MTNPRTTVSSNCFPPTLWTQLISIIQKGGEAAAWQALGEFCESYRPAIRNFFRRHGSGPDDADDLTQKFFQTRIVGRWEAQDGFLHKAKRLPQTRFRSFLAQVLWRFLQDEWKSRKTARSGGGVVPIPLEDVEMTGEVAEGEAYKKFGKEFDRVFALEILHRAAGRSGRSRYLLAHLRGEMSQEEAARRLGLSVNAFKQAYLRFRERLARELREEVAKLAGPDEKEIRAELKYLMSLF